MNENEQPRYHMEVERHVAKSRKADLNALKAANERLAACVKLELEYMDDCVEFGMIFDPEWQMMLGRETLEAELARDAILNAQ